MEFRFTEKATKIAAFDLDGTIIKTKSGKKFPVDKNDFQLLFPNVLEKINEYKQKNYKIVIFSNQLGVKKGKINLSDILFKINKVLGKDCDYFIAIDDDIHRKPFPTMFTEFYKLNGKIQDVFYVGDAAGRPKDFSDSDINFAHNISLETGLNLKFYTPEQFFTNKKETVNAVCPKFNEPCNIPNPSSFSVNTVIMLTGYPASGKSSFARFLQKNRKDVDIVSNDELGPKKAETFYKKLLEKQNNIIVVDNLNTTKKTRSSFMKLAKEYHYKIVGIHIITPIEIAMFMNQYRIYKEGAKKIPDVVYYTYRKNYEELSVDEGFHLMFEMMPNFGEIKYCF